MGASRVLAIVGAGVLVACADPMHVTDVDASIDDPRSLAAWVETPMLAIPSGAALPSTPAPLAASQLRHAPSGAVACPLALPEGDCDRCPERPCRQVRLSSVVPPSEAPWAMFCEQGDVREEARIACLCAGGAARYCDLAANDAVVALTMIDVVFGGAVPPVGTRYRDSNGLRAIVDQATHDWLAHVASPQQVMRCDPPDPIAATLRYESLAQRVRMSGSCDPLEP
ncbi:hypothetical protein [Sandaracinus amylolyticus]|uniref:hypothetical protein n=1 Tax=Sandaracinus amylolyticus TaxID=927083 RepID=UPI001F19CFDE|nr:hypothetical protein [Sandaracinus amylolyticus]UJR85836.1 Hypothetical protein I5071_79160 [Sandaracinus amylolyticus]